MESLEFSDHRSLCLILGSSFKMFKVTTLWLNQVLRTLGFIQTQLIHFLQKLLQVDAAIALMFTDLSKELAFLFFEV